MSKSVYLFVVMCLVPYLASAAETVNPVKVYVFAKASADGFVDSTRLQDSVRDVQGNIASRKTMTLVDSPEQATITLELVAAGEFPVNSTSTQYSKGIFGGVNATTKQQMLPGIDSILRVRGTDYAKPITYIQQLFWRDLAKRLVGQVDEWIKANRAQLEKAAQ